MLSDSGPGSPPSSVKSPWPFNMKGEPGDVPVPRGKVAQEISDLLAQVHHDDVCFGGPAFLLPILPGLQVSSIGTVSLPLREEMVEKLKSQASEDHAQSWVIPASRVTMKNPEWEPGIEMLSAFSAEKLGFKDIVLQTKLTRVLVCGPGGGVESQPRAMTGRCVATLVVQPPSEYTGGDLMVSRAGTESEVRYGRELAAAAFRPHYVVYAAGASCYAEKVTTGYRLALEYQLLLPPQAPLDYGKRSRLLLLSKLADAVKQLKAGPDDVGAIEDVPAPDNAVRDASETENDGGVLAFVLSQPYKRTELLNSGSEVLSGVDRDRFQLLRDANSLLPPGKQLQFYFVQSNFTERMYMCTKEVIVWRSTTGNVVGNGTITAQWNQLNFLNPDNESLGQLWEITGKSIMSRCERCVIAMWPNSADIVTKVALMGIAAAIPTVLERGTLSNATVRMLLKNDVLGIYDFARAVQSSKTPIQLLEFCQTLVPAIIKVGDPKLVKLFFKKYFDFLSDAEKTEFLPWLRLLVRDFGWENVDSCIIAAIDCPLHETSLNRALVLAESLSDRPTARAELTVFAVGKAQLLSQARPDALAFLASTGLLWKNALESGSTRTFLSVKNLIARTSPKHLGSVVTELSKYVDASSLPEHRAMLASIAWARRQWLINEILDCEKPFTWTMTDTNFHHAAEVLIFLRSPAPSLVIPNLNSMSDARLLTAKLHQKIQAPLSITAERQGQNVLVQIKKTGGQFDNRRKMVPTYMAEIQRLGQLLPLDESTNNADTHKTQQVRGTKRPRPRESEVIIIE